MTAFVRACLAQLMIAETAVPPVGETRMLIVDDETSVCLYVERVLRRFGYQPVLASCGDEALQKAAVMGHLDVLVTDLMMPAMNGDELARQLRMRHPDLKVLYLTGFSDRLFAEKVTLWDGEAFLDKPCSITGLGEAVSLLAYGRLGQPAPSEVESQSVPAVWT
jgi:two-component system cell cycle sensor histidine kinase/response regulator CckA